MGTLEVYVSKKCTGWHIRNSGITTGEMNRVLASIFQSVYYSVYPSCYPYFLRSLNKKVDLQVELKVDWFECRLNCVVGKQAVTNNLQKLVALRHGNKNCRLIYVRIVDSRAIFYSVILPLLPGKKLLLKFTKHTPPVDRTHSTSTSNIRACTCSNDGFLKE